MAGATAARVLLIRIGVSSWALGATVITCASTTTSVLIFRDRRPR